MLFALACGRTDTFAFPAEPKSIEQACRDVCEKSTCDQMLQVSEAELAQCANSCADELPRALGMSQACGDAYRDYIDCLDALTCEAYQAQIFEGELGDCRVAAEELSRACTAD